ncbi:glutathione S-transferase alpha 1 L homeolog [Xenopus laevis]|uniref:glutathione transferase n=1 Tax=Xenopus laevis TaxID=8355 RepID=A1L2Q6_XENLA|nr:glutathione S-transferase alpha 1 L homeolog [Xenopus laevis]AAI29661.1 LOC100036921 protein [Xenopus laevis]
MAEKPVLHYFNGRGRMESIRWLLAAAGVEFDEQYIETREQYEQLLKDGSLMFEQVPLVQMDGMNLIQIKAILSYIAGKYNMYGKDLKERLFIDMYVDGTGDLLSLGTVYVFLDDAGKEKQKANIKEKATKRYFPIYEKVLKDQHYLVGNKFSWADVQLMEAILMTEEFHSDILSCFPNLKDFKERIKQIPTIAKFLQPGSPKKPFPDMKYVTTVKTVLNM